MVTGNLHDEIATVSYGLYEKSGYLESRTLANWLEAERIVLVRHASQQIEEPEGEDPVIAAEGLTEEVEGPEQRDANQEKEDGATVMEEIEVKGPVIAAEKRAAEKRKIKHAGRAIA